MTPQEEVESLIARVAMGDRAALTGLYDSVSAKLFGVCLRILQDRAEAEDVLQEVFVTVWNTADSHRLNGYTPMGWLITITRERAVTRRRALGRPSTAIDTADLMPTRRSPPDGTAQAISDARRITACLDELPRAHAHLVHRACLDGDSYADLAQATGVDAETLQTKLRHSLLALRACLSR